MRTCIPPLASVLALLVILPGLAPRPAAATDRLELKHGDRIVLLGSGMASRMDLFGHFETELHLRHPEKDLTIRNLGREGDTPAFRPHPGRGYEDQFAFPGAKELVKPEYRVNSNPQGHLETPDQWLSRLKADVIIAFFGFNESFEGPEGLERYRAELGAFLKHTLAFAYNGETPPRLALVSPAAIQDLSSARGTPDGRAENENLRLYTEASAEVAAAHGVPFVDAFAPSLAWYAEAGGEEYTVDGAILNDRGYRALAPVLADALFGEAEIDEASRSGIHTAVVEKLWAWRNDFRIPNGVHVYGRRFEPFGPGNYPHELRKAREMTDNRDRAIWAALKGESYDLAAADAATHVLPPVVTNYEPSPKTGNTVYRHADETHGEFTVAPGYEISLFASEAEFPDLANPVQIAFDNRGRLWVATMPSYPHYRIGDPRPADKLLILEDTTGDGRADKQTVFADDLHIPIGFEISHDGVYVSQSNHLVLLKDTNGDDRYDVREALMSGFDDHDTHHAISAFCADPSGAIVMAEGLFHHTHLESVYGPVRATNGGFFRFAPQRRHIMRYAQFRIPNPWGIAFDDYGQDFFLHTSGTSLSWMLPGTVKAVYGVNYAAPDLIESEKVRPTSGLEFVSSRHFPDEVQGDIVFNNSIGFLGAKQHRMIENGTGYTTEFRHDLFVSTDGNFRPVDLEFAPDGSLYVADWHNALIGHMQHSARDPNRDRIHGRIYRITYPSRPLVDPPLIHEAPVETLLENLKLPEQRARYRTRRELRARDSEAVLAALAEWLPGVEDDHHRLEALWVTWGLDRVDEALLESLLASEDHRVRAAAVRVLRFNAHRVADWSERLLAAAADPHGRVRLEAVVAASFAPEETGLAILAKAEEQEVEESAVGAYKGVRAALTGSLDGAGEEPRPRAPQHLTGDDALQYLKGAEIYAREAHCGTCHQANGQGLSAAGFPPLDGTRWVTGSPERLIKLSLKGMMGPIEVKGVAYPGVVPMTPFEHLLKDEDLAAVLTYVRNSWGNRADPITPEQIAAVRAEVKERALFYQPAELLQDHPLETPVEE